MDLSNKYQYLDKNKIELENLKKLALLTKDIKIVKRDLNKSAKKKKFSKLTWAKSLQKNDEMNSYPNKNDDFLVRRQLRKMKMWERNETLCLVFLAEKLG